MTYQTHGAKQYGQWAQMIGATRSGIAGGVDLNGSLPSERSREASKAQPYGGGQKRTMTGRSRVR